MKIVYFNSVSLNGYLKFDLKFNNDLTFLIGINGSGKTSILKAIMALLSPDIDWLMNAAFDTISVGLVDENRTISVRAISVDAHVEIELMDGRKRSIFKMLRKDYRELTKQSENYYMHAASILSQVRVTESRAALPQSAALDALRALPTPIFLGLDRTTLAAPKEERLKSSVRRDGKLSHATFRSHLDESIAQAQSIATEALKEANQKRSALALKLRQAILLSFFSEDVKDTKGLEMPSASDIRRFERTRNSLKKAFSLLGIPAQESDKKIEGFFSTIIDTAERIKDIGSFIEIVNEDSIDPRRDYLFSWFSLSPRLLMVEHVAKLVSDFNSAAQKIFLKTDSYLAIVNSFLGDTKKNMSFTNNELLDVFIDQKIHSDIYSLSSGERQLFVLITTLMFNNNAEQANILIIDEPELSLHLKWQEMFVDSLRKANPKTQLIFATHSPSIILDEIQKCVDIA